MTDLAAQVAAEHAAQGLPEYVERIRTQVRESRRRQGFPEHVTDADVLDRLAAMVADVRSEHADAPVGRPGRRSTSSPGHATKGGRRDGSA